MLSLFHQTSYGVFELCASIYKYVWKDHKRIRFSSHSGRSVHNNLRNYLKNNIFKQNLKPPNFP